MDHAEVIASVASSLRDVPGIRALFLSGSYGNGLADQYSDIDFILVAEEGPTDEIAALWRQAISRTDEIVLWWDRTTRPALINAITADWTRTDVVILKPEQMKWHNQAALKVLFDHDGIHETLPKAAPPKKSGPARLKYQIEEFIRILGLLPLADGRKEYLNGVLGIFYLRNHLVELLIEETGAPNRGGVLHLNRLISADQQALLAALPPAVPVREDLIAAQLAYAEAYLPRARRLAAERGVDWPERFEEVTWAKLHETLGVERPYPPT